MPFFDGFDGLGSGVVFGLLLALTVYSYTSTYYKRPVAFIIATAAFLGMLAVCLMFFPPHAG